MNRLLKSFASTTTTSRAFYASSSSSSSSTLNSKGPLFVFLEGGAAVGKSALCNELLSRNYTVQFENFVELCKLNPRYDPGGSVMSIKWISAMFTSLENFVDGSRDGRKILKNDVVFFDRSFLTPWIYTRGDRNNLYCLDAMNEVRETFNCCLVLCEARPAIVKQRLFDRFSAGTEEEKKIRQNLGEMNDEYVERIDRGYKKLKDDGWFDAVLSTDMSDVPSTAETLLHTIDALRIRGLMRTTRLARSDYL